MKQLNLVCSVVCVALAVLLSALTVAEAAAGQNTEQPLYLRNRTGIEKFLQSRWHPLWGLKKWHIVAGLEGDEPLVISPRRFDPVLINVHKPGEAQLPMTEKCRRATKATLALGWRELLLCYVYSNDIPRQWDGVSVLFSQALIEEIDGTRWVACLCTVNYELFPKMMPTPGGAGAKVLLRKLSKASPASERFPRIRGL